MQNRTNIRQRIRQQRRQLTPAQQQDHAKKAMNLLIKQTFYIETKNIALYLANDGEIDPNPIIEHAQKHNKNCYLPVMHPTREHHLLFMPYQPGDRLVRNCFNILEPVFIPEVVAFPWQLDLVITPLVAFDNNGNRLGVGAGCYDRSFYFLKHQQHKPCLLIGMAHEIQQLENIEQQPWDISLNGILTEKRLKIF